MNNSQDYRKEILNELAQGDTETLDESSAESYQTFDDFAQRSSKEQRRRFFERSFHPDRIPMDQMEPELKKAIAQIKPNERDDVAREFFKRLKERGIDERHLEQQLGLSTHHANRMNSDDVSKLAAFVYHNHPDIFQDVLAEQPTIVKFFSNPVVGAALGAIAAKWFGGRK